MDTPNRQQRQYQDYKKPSWAPPSSVFGPVWSVLYTLIAISFGYVAYLFWMQQISLFTALPFALNLIFNAAFTTLQFKYRAYSLAALDTVLLWASLLWALLVIYPYVPWVSYINIPYLMWASFAMILQITVAKYNRTT